MYGQISTTLVALLPLAATVNGFPFRISERADEKPGCSAISFGNFAWTISDFIFNATYTFTTPAHQNSWGYVNFDVSNPAFSAETDSAGGATSEATCTAASSRLNNFFYSDTPYTCTSETSDRRKTEFDFDRTTGLLRLNESWVCTDVDPMFPTIFTAHGAVNIALDCETKKYENKNWTIGEIYSQTVVTCEPVNLTLKPNEISAIA